MAKNRWGLIKKKIKVIRMMAKIGGDKVQQMNERQQKIMEHSNEEQ